MPSEVLHAPATLTRRTVMTAPWLSAAVLVMFGTGCIARLGQLNSQLLTQNDSSWAGWLVLVSIPLLGALHVAFVRSAAGVRDPAVGLWRIARVLFWAWLRLGFITLLMCAPIALLLATIGHYAFGWARLAEATLPLVAGLVTFAPSLLVVDPNRFAMSAVLRSIRVARQPAARRVVLASTLLSAAETLFIQFQSTFGWAGIAVRLILGAAAVAVAARTAEVVVDAVLPEVLAGSLATVRVSPHREAWARAIATIAAGGAVAVMLAGQPLRIGQLGGGGGNAEGGTAGVESVRNLDAVPVTLIATAKSNAAATLTDIGFSHRGLAFGFPLTAPTLQRRITLQPGEQVYVWAVWRIGCDPNSLSLTIQVRSHLVGIRRIHDTVPISTSAPC